MAIKRYLAMTAAEIGNHTSLPPEIAWMACHFSPYSTGLSNCPATLPPDSLLIVNDVTPIHGHSPEVIAWQLTQCVSALGCCGVLLDFQRPDVPETAALAEHLANTLSCPVAVSELYAHGQACPVFLPPCPHHVPLSEYIQPWQDREVWLELALDAEAIALTESGAAFAPLPPGDVFPNGHRDETLHCHYKIKLEENSARFTLWRTPEDLDTLLEEANTLGITHAVGLYQELCDCSQT